MGYLPLAVVRHSFSQFCASRRFQRLSATYRQLHDFINYIDTTYFRGPFLPVMWNVYSRDNSNRTNNHVEGMLPLYILRIDKCYWVYIPANTNTFLERYINVFTKLRKCFFLMFCEHEFVDSHLRLSNVIRKRYDVVLVTWTKRLTKPYIRTLRPRF
jgi:hypothetical protein